MDKTNNTIKYTKDPNNLSKILVVFLWVFIVSNVLGIITDTSIISVYNEILNGGAISDQKANEYDQRESLLGIVWMLSFIVSGVFFLKWIYRANANCKGFGANDMKFTSGWSIGWYFIPIMNFFKPFKAMEEIWLVSHKGPEKWQTIEDAAKEQNEKKILNLWWLFWIGSFIFGQQSSRLYNKAEDLDSLINAYYFSIGHYLWEIILTLIAIKLVKSIQSSQNKLTKKIITANTFPREQ